MFFADDMVVIDTTREGPKQRLEIWRTEAQDGQKGKGSRWFQMEKRKDVQRLGEKFKWVNASK